MKAGIFFSGIGHWACAAKNAGMDVGWAYEKADFGKRGFADNHPGVKLVDDVESVLPADVVVGSPWCVGFSQGNPRATESHPANSCVFEFLDALEIASPKCFIMEITPRFETRYPNLYNRWQSRLSMLRYKFTKMELNASDFGSAQVRRRLYYIGAEDMDLEQFKKQMLMKLDMSKTVKSVFDEVPEEKDVYGANCIEWKPGWKGVWGMLQDGKWQKRQLKWDGKSPTLTSSAGRDIIRPDEKRFITVKQGLALMGLPLDTKFYTKSVAMQFRMIASGVDVACTTKLLSTVKEIQEGLK